MNRSWQARLVLPCTLTERIAVIGLVNQWLALFQLDPEPSSLLTCLDEPCLNFAFRISLKSSLDLTASVSTQLSDIS